MHWYIDSTYITIWLPDILTIVQDWRRLLLATRLLRWGIISLPHRLHLNSPALPRVGYPFTAGWIGTAFENFAEKLTWKCTSGELSNYSATALPLCLLDHLPTILFSRPPKPKACWRGLDLRIMCGAHNYSGPQHDQDLNQGSFNLEPRAL